MGACAWGFYVACCIKLSYRVGATGTVGPVLAGPIFVRKRGRDKLCTNAILYQ